MDKFDLDTPCIVLDLDILEKNLGQMQAGATAAGKNLRPHAKSHKCSILARKQLEQGAIGICAAKVSEAEVLVNGGIRARHAEFALDDRQYNDHRPHTHTADGRYQQGDTKACPRIRRVNAGRADTVASISSACDVAGFLVFFWLHRS